MFADWIVLDPNNTLLAQFAFTFWGRKLQGKPQFLIIHTSGHYANQYVCIFPMNNVKKKESKVDARTPFSVHVAILSLTLYHSLRRTTMTTLFYRWQSLCSRAFRFVSKKPRNLSIFIVNFKKIFTHCIYF